jgi:hypothetical protein
MNVQIAPEAAPAVAPAAGRLPRSLEEKHWQILLGRIANGNCVPLLGGAMHRPGSIKPGCELAQKWASDFGYPLDDKNDLARVARFVAIEYDDLFPKQEIAKQIKRAVAPDFSNPLEPHRVLADLELKAYMTTNYDDFMFQALEYCKKEPKWDFYRWHSGLRNTPSIFDAEDLRINAANPLVYYFHGHANDLQSMVVTEDDYLDYLANLGEDSRMLIPPQLQGALTQSSLLFLGYRVYDWDFRVLFRSLAPYIRRWSERGKKVSVAVQIVPLGDDAAVDQVTEAVAFLDKYFDDYDVHIFWGDCHQFAAELRRRWDAFTAEAHR